MIGRDGDLILICARVNFGTFWRGSHRTWHVLDEERKRFEKRTFMRTVERPIWALYLEQERNPMHWS